MDRGKIRVFLYWDGDIVTGENGSQYSIGAKRFIKVNRGITLQEMLRKLHHVTNIDATKFKLLLSGRYPLCITPTLKFVTIPVGDDEELDEFLSIPTNFPQVHMAELYIEQEPLDIPVTNLNESSSGQQENVSFSQLLNSGPTLDNLGEPWSHYGSFLSNNCGNLVQHTEVGTSPIHSQADVDLGTTQLNVSDGRASHILTQDNDAGGQRLNDGGESEGNRSTDSDHDWNDTESEEGSDDGSDSANEIGGENLRNDVFREDEGASIPFLSNIGDEKDHMIDNFDDHRRPVWFDDRTSVMEVGMTFKSKEGLQHAVKCWSMRVHRYYKVYESTPSSWFVRCLYYKDQNCLWRLRGTLKKKHGLFEITKLMIQHTCIPPVQFEDHPNLDHGMVGRMVRNHIEENALYKVADVAANVRSFGVDISYKKAWLGKRNAIKRVYGDWDTSYQMLPRFLGAVQQSNPGTVVEWRHTEDSTGNYKVFHSIFWAFKPSIDGFKHCRPVITIDGTHQYGKYKEKILIAVGVDAAGHIFPLAFAIVDEESLANWSWFLAQLVRHVIQGRNGICMLSDRHKGILRAIETNPNLQPPAVHHRLCLRHVQENFSKKFKNTVLNELMDKAARYGQVRKFEIMMSKIRDISEEAHKWLHDIPLQKWTLSHDGGFRYGVMTTNRSESFNSALKGARKLPITACVRATFYRLVKYFDKYQMEARKYVDNGDPWPKSILEKYLQTEQKSKLHRVTAFVREEGLYEVRTGVRGGKGGNLHTVHLSHKSCTCGKFEIYKMPCSHVMKVCENMGRTSVELVDGVYRSSKMKDTYSMHFHPMPHEELWPVAPFHLVANFHRLNDRLGRPRSLRIRNEQDRARMKKCQACGEMGHKRPTCPNIQRLRQMASSHR